MLRCANTFRGSNAQSHYATRIAIGPRRNRVVVSSITICIRAVSASSCPDSVRYRISLSSLDLRALSAESAHM